MQAKREAFDGSRLGDFFVQVVPYIWGSFGQKRVFVCSCGHQDAFELALVLVQMDIFSILYLRNFK